MVVVVLVRGGPSAEGMDGGGGGVVSEGRPLS